MMRQTRKKTLTSSVAVLGSLILFLSWIFQQTLLEEANNTLQQINSAQSVYQTYQANNAMFNAIIATTTDPQSIEQIRRFQTYNYELGLRDMERLLDEKAKRTIPEAADAYDFSTSATALSDVTQERLGKIQEELMKKEDEIEQRKTNRNRVFLVIYSVGSVMVLVGSVLSARASSHNNS